MRVVNAKYRSTNERLRNPTFVRLNAGWIRVRLAEELSAGVSPTLSLAP